MGKKRIAKCPVCGFIKDIEILTLDENDEIRYDAKIKIVGPNKQLYQSNLKKAYVTDYVETQKKNIRAEYEKFNSNYMRKVKADDA